MDCPVYEYEWDVFNAYVILTNTNSSKLVIENTSVMMTHFEWFSMNKVYLRRASPLFLFCSAHDRSHEWVNGCSPTCYPGSADRVSARVPVQLAAHRCTTWRWPTCWHHVIRSLSMIHWRGKYRWWHFRDLVNVTFVMSLEALDIVRW